MIIIHDHHSMIYDEWDQFNCNVNLLDFLITLTLTLRCGDELTSRWISRFIAAGLIGTFVLPSLMGTMVDRWPHALGWGEFLVIAIQGSCFLMVWCMPSSKRPSSSSVTSTAATVECT